jgi:hypothetical protein
MTEGRGGDRRMAEERDLGDIVLSWSVQEIMDDELYKGKVLDHALGSRAWSGGFVQAVAELRDLIVSFIYFFSGFS